jgi:hypothetical protein
MMMDKLDFNSLKLLQTSLSWLAMFRNPGELSTNVKKFSNAIALIQVALAAKCAMTLGN